MFYFIDYSEEASDLTVMSPLLLSALPDFLWSQRVWWDDSLVGGGVFFLFFQQLDWHQCVYFWALITNDGSLSGSGAQTQVLILVTSCTLSGRCHHSAPTIPPLCWLRGPVISGEKCVRLSKLKYQSWKSYWGFNTWGLQASADKMEQKQTKAKLLQISQNIHILTRTINSQGGCLTLLTLESVGL